MPDTCGKFSACEAGRSSKSEDRLATRIGLFPLLVARETRYRTLIIMQQPQAYPVIDAVDALLQALAEGFLYRRRNQAGYSVDL